MARHFGPQHAKSNYAAMGNCIGRPIHAGAKNHSVADSIARARAIAAREAKAKSSKKK